MNATTNALRAGLRGGWTEFKQTLTSGQDIFYYLFLPVISIAAIALMGDATFRDSHLSLRSLALPSVFAVIILSSGVTTVATWLTLDRDDGTLLRMKATPGGLIGYLVGKTVFIVATAAVSMVLVLAPGLILFDGFVVGSIGVWVGVVAVFVLGMLATVPVGAIVGSLGDNPKSVNVVLIPVIASVAISGIFYPLTALPGWLQVIGQVLPTYWIGLGMRSALLPDSFATVEIGGTWRHLEMVGVLGSWAVVGFLVAPIVLRRMARRESGANLTQRRLKVMQRIQ